MKKNILIAGFIKSVNEEVAKALSDNLNMFYLSVSDLTLYYANRSSKDDVLKEGGEALYNKFVKFALKDAKEFENTLASLDMNDVSIDGLSSLLDTSLIVFLGAPYKYITKFNDAKKELVDNSRLKYKSAYDIFINIDGLGNDKILEKIITEITSYYGG